MKKVLVLLSSVLMTGCFICHKTAAAPQEEAIVTNDTGIVEQQSPVAEEKVITRHTIPEAANFAFNSRELKPGMNRMDEVMKDLQAHPDAVVFVEGHTDNIGSEEYNKQLSLDRARAVAQELVAQGCSNQVRVYGAGSSMPIASNDTAEGRAQNRRVDIIIAKDDEN